MSSPFSLFFLTLQHLPITYQSFLYRRSELAGADGLAARMKQDIVNLLFDELEYFQSFDKVKFTTMTGRTWSLAPSTQP